MPPTHTYRTYAPPPPLCRTYCTPPPFVGPIAPPPPPPPPPFSFRTYAPPLPSVGPIYLTTIYGQYSSLLLMLLCVWAHNTSGPQTIDTIFGNFTELHELAVQFQCSLEECIEMSAEADKDEERHPQAGFVFEDLAEVHL